MPKNSQYPFQRFAKDGMDKNPPSFLGDKNMVTLNIAKGKCRFSLLFMMGFPAQCSTSTWAPGH